MNGRGTDLRATPLRPPGGRRNETGMIPLINIVLLLIFFLIAGRIADVQDRGNIRPPPSASDEPVWHPPVTLALDPRGRLTLNGTDVSFETAGTALQTGHPLEDPYRRVRAMRLAEGASDVLRLNLARGRLDLQKGRI